MKLSAFWNITDLLSPAMLLDWLLYMQPQLRVLRRWRPKLQSFLKLRFWDLNSITSSTFYWSKVKGQSHFKAWGNRVHLLLGGVAKNLWPYLIYHTYTIISSSKIDPHNHLRVSYYPHLRNKEVEAGNLTQLLVSEYAVLQSLSECANQWMAPRGEWQGDAEGGRRSLGPGDQWARSCDRRRLLGSLAPPRPPGGRWELWSPAHLATSLPSNPKSSP